MTTSTLTPGRFVPAMIGDLDEPVRRYFTHALAEGAPLAPRARLRIRGRIKVGPWLPFDSTWEGDGRSLTWRALCGPRRLPLLRVHDQFAGGIGFMDIRLRPRLKLVHAESQDAARSGAVRAALESMWVPASLLPEHGVTWRAEADDMIVATFDVPPERPEVWFEIGPDGAVKSEHAQRWQSAKTGYVPFGAEVHAERTFGGITIPSRILGGWGYGTAEWSPFFDGEVTAFDPID